jgi:hypothetical protein
MWPTLSMNNCAKPSRGLPHCPAPARRQTGAGCRRCWPALHIQQLSTSLSSQRDELLAAWYCAVRVLRMRQDLPFCAAVELLLGDGSAPRGGASSAAML